MQCVKCGESIPAGEERELHGRTLCEDCYMDGLSPPRTCDPWAVHSAKSFLQQAPAGKTQLTPRQERILGILRETGGIEPKDLSARLQVSLPDLEREIAALRHMEKLRGALKGSRRILRLWEEEG